MRTPERKKIRRRVIAESVLALLLSAVALPAETRIDPALPADAAATVNGQAIPRRLVEIFLKNDREALGLVPTREDDRAKLTGLPPAILDELIDRALIMQEARRRGIDATREKLDAEEKRLLDFCGNEARYAAYVADNGFDRPGYRENVLRPAADGQAMIAALTRDLTATDDEIKAYYEAHADDGDFQRPERVAGEHILIAARPGVLAARLEHSEGLKPGTKEMDAAVARETAAARQRADAVRQQAAAPGADFPSLARRLSEDPGTRDAGGSLGTFARGVHPLTLDDAFFALKPGEVGPVVATEYGFHVLRITARLPAGRQSLADAGPEIRRRLLREKSAQRLREWLAEVRAKALIVVRDPHDLPEKH